jgi:hypothetical protein
LYPEDYPSITKAQFGVVFLGTPHLGSQLADWNELAKGAGASFLGMRSEIVNVLETFNTQSFHSQNAWEHKRGEFLPFTCFCEERESNAGLGKKMVCSSRLALSLVLSLQGRL